MCFQTSLTDPVSPNFCLSSSGLQALGELGAHLRHRACQKALHHHISSCQAAGVLGEFRPAYLIVAKLSNTSRIQTFFVSGGIFYPPLSCSKILPSSHMETEGRICWTGTTESKSRAECRLFVHSEQMKHKCVTAGAIFYVASVLPVCY